MPRLLKRKSFLAALSMLLVLPVVLYACAGSGEPGQQPWHVEPGRTQVAGMADLVWYASASDGKEKLQPVIFVHGTPGRADGWKDYIHNAPAGFRFIAVDRPGFGSSEHEVVPQLARQADALAALMSELLAEHHRPVILVGHSLGGPIVARAAIDYPDQVGALVILAGSVDPELEKINLLQYLGKTWPVSKLLPRALYNANLEIFALEGELEVLGERLDDISIPVIILHGTKDGLVPFENVAYMEQMLINARVEVVPLIGQNHFLPWNSKGFVDQAINSAAARMNDTRG